LLQLQEDLPRRTKEARYDDVAKQRGWRQNPNREGLQVGSYSIAKGGPLAAIDIDNQSVPLWCGATGIAAPVPLGREFFLCVFSSEEALLV
jgi:hypothetical protein